MDQEKMDELEQVKRRARHIARSLVFDNLEPLLNPNKESPSENWVGFMRMLKCEENNEKLNQQILDYLQTDNDPNLQDCNESFKGVREALMMEGIILDDQNRLKLLTPEEQHAEIIKGARPIVLSIVYDNIKTYISKKCGNISNFNTYYETITNESYKEQLDQDIIQYLINEQDPKYYWCPFSFKGIKENLKNNEIVLNKKKGTLRFLTHWEKRRIEEEYKMLIMSFTEL